MLRRTYEIEHNMYFLLYAYEYMCGILHLWSTVSCQMSAQTSIQCVEYAFTIIYLLLVAKIL